MSFEIQELPDVIRIIVLLNLTKGAKLKKRVLKRRIDRVCVRHACINTSELDKALSEMAAEKLIVEEDEYVYLTPQGQKLGKEWESLLLKKEPIMEVVAGLVDGSITSLVVILSAFIATLTATSSFLSNQPAVIFAAFLTLSAVSITNFSSFLLGGITEDLNDIMTLQNLMNYSLSDIPDKKERDKSLLLVQKLFTLLGKEIHRSNLYAAIICGVTTFIAGIIPIATYLALPMYYNIGVSLLLVSAIVGVFLVRYRSKKTRVLESHLSRNLNHSHHSNYCIADFGRSLTQQTDMLFHQALIHNHIQPCLLSQRSGMQISHAQLHPNHTWMPHGLPEFYCLFDYGLHGVASAENVYDVDGALDFLGDILEAAIAFFAQNFFDGGVYGDYFVTVVLEISGYEVAGFA